MPKSSMAGWMPISLGSPQLTDGAARIFHGHRFGDFQFQIPALEAVAAQKRGHGLHQVGRAPLLGGQVDRHTDVFDSFRPPGGQFPAGFVQHPAAQGFDQAGFLGDGDLSGSSAWRTR